MKEIKAYIRCDRAAKVHAALSEAGISHMTLSQVLAVGAHSDTDQAKLSIEFGCYVDPRVKVEIICLDKDETRTVEIVRKAASTGQPGDGIITIANVNRLVKIRTAAESVEAL
jgi:nitrogen regulatory protein PII